LLTLKTLKHQIVKHKNTASGTLIFTTTMNALSMHLQCPVTC